METPRHRGSIVGPIILIGLGIIFLLQNTGAVSWDVWRVIIKLWPVLLIAVGLDIMFGRRSAAGAVLVPLAVLGLVGIGAWVVWSQAPGEGWVREQVHETVAGAARADVDVNFGAGVLRVGSLPGADMLISGFVSVAKDDQVTSSFSVSGDTAYYRLKDHDITVMPFVGQDGANRLWELNLGREGDTYTTPDYATASDRVELDVKGGIGEVVVQGP